MVITNQMIQIHKWQDKDLELLFDLNSAVMTEHLGGPESEEKILQRHKRYLELGERGQMFIVTLDSVAAGSVGYWQTSWKGEDVYETGWSVLPTFQGKGIAGAAAKLAVEAARAENKHASIHAFPSISNTASNAICRKLGFELLGKCELEYPPGSIMQCNDWRLGLK
ncbi:GNAT family N-acetyltransferase [Fictibacillus aquaticus]|uniref:GNAT family N-acetyltransferase n=1 Tax=Fictibacillus aquaticus TaxID=2021314 RepID=A0A235F8U4_9BACL|nr:GNAT family N-acetyltransferase [Fictibacillus aquaticus]OYD57672.1 GNAT family N-acetyltransferase [Fictibacillus aquaticus]